MAVPLAVSPSKVTPGFYLSVNLLAGPPSPGAGARRVLLLAPKLSSGNLALDTEIRLGAGPDDAATAFGVGSVGHLAAKILYKLAPDAQIYFGAPTAGAGTATLTVTATGSPGAAGNGVLFDIAGRETVVEWAGSESNNTFRTRAIAQINAMTQDLPVVASAGASAGEIDLDAKGAGNVYEDVLVKVTLVDAQTGTEAIDTNTYTALSGASGDPSLATILAAAAGIEFAYILPCLSNADAEGAGTTNTARAVTHIETYNHGLNAKLQQVIVASTTTIANAKVATAARNDTVMEHVCVINGRSLPAEFAAVELGQRLAASELDPAANRIGQEYDYVYGAADIVADTPTDAELEDALTHGVTILSYTAGGQLYVVRPITTYHVDGAGGPDRRLLDVQNVDTAYAVARDLRSALPQAFKGVKITRDVPEGEEPPPPGVVEERDIKAFVISRLLYWARTGAIIRSELDAAINAGELIVEVNDSDASQVDIVIPIKVIPPLAKMGVVVNRVPN